MAGERRRVKVVVRVRPALDETANLWVQAISGTVLQTVNHRNTHESLQYEFASVYNCDASQKMVYDECAKPMLAQILKGKNGSVFAYGPTGAGKTHTILGTAENPGIIPRCVKDMMNLVEEARNSEEGKDWNFFVTYSYMEVYNEKVYDLISGQGVDLPIREDGHRNIFVAGLTEQRIDNVQSFNESFGPATKKRTTAATKLNIRSSRSHSILLLKIVRVQKQAPYKRLTGKLYVIDLAGSEDNRRTGNQGIRLKESGAINSSLLALGQVVDALNKAHHAIPYRGSKLTRLLQDSLGGNAETCMIVNIAPEEQHYFDTHSTLHFACKTKKIVNTIMINESFEKVVKPGVKRSLPDSTCESEEKKKPKLDVKSPERLPPPVPAPFLSPLLREQANLRCEMLQRLGELESRLLNQMSSHLSEQENPEPDSTTTTTIADSKAPALPAPLVELQNLKEKLTKIGSTTPKAAPEKATLVKRKALLRCKGKVFSDGSVEGDFSDMPKVTASPLFRNMPEPLVKKKSARSTASSKPGKVLTDKTGVSVNKPAPTQINPDAQIARSKVLTDKTGVSVNKPAPTQINPDAQIARNERVLDLLNTGTVKELQGLQKVGAKRAQLIFDYREIHGTFASFDDLYDITGLTAKYMDSLLKSNFVSLQT